MRGRRFTRGGEGGSLLVSDGGDLAFLRQREKVVELEEVLLLLLRWKNFLAIIFLMGGSWKGNSKPYQVICLSTYGVGVLVWFGATLMSREDV